MATQNEYVEMALNTFMAHLASAGTPTDPLAETGLHVYLSQCPIAGGSAPAQLPELMPAVQRPDQLFTPGTFVEANVWANGSAILTNAHFDSNHNILCVCMGAKRVALVSPGDAAAAGELRPQPVWAASPNHAHADLFAPPPGSALAAAVTYLDVRAGDAVFIPEGWWHAVRSAPATVAVNFWYGGARAALAGAAASRYVVRTLVQQLTAERLVRWRQEVLKEITPNHRAHPIERILTMRGIDLAPFYTDGGSGTPRWTAVQAESLGTALQSAYSKNELILSLAAHIVASLPGAAALIASYCTIAQSATVGSNWHFLCTVFEDWRCLDLVVSKWEQPESISTFEAYLLTLNPPVRLSEAFATLWNRLAGIRGDLTPATVVAAQEKSSQHAFLLVMSDVLGYHEQ
jgi:hypothetical protein